MQPRGGESETMCPVCTLFLRPGITLKQHLASHPKQKVIDALVKLSLFDDVPKHSQASQSQESLTEALPQNQQVTQEAPYTAPLTLGPPSNIGAIPGNHFFMYQQSMSTTTPHQSNISPMPFSPFTQQYLVPTVYNAQMMPYFYQQQQLIMSSNGIPPVRALSFDAGQTNRALEATETVVKEKESEKCEADKEQEKVEEEPQETEPSRQSSIGSSIQEVATTSAILPKGQENDSVIISDNDDDSNSVYKSEEYDGRPESTYSHLEIESSSVHDYQSNIQEPDTDSQYNVSNMVDHEEGIVPVVSSGWTFTHDLNKACQTQNSTNISLRSPPHNEEPHSIVNEPRSDYFFVDQRSEMSDVHNSDDHHSSFEQSEPIYTSANIINNTEGMDFMSIDEIEGMQVIIGDFSNSSLVAPAENYDTSQPENPPILMTISGVSMLSPRHSHSQSSESKVEILEHEIIVNSIDDNCIENVNIRSDEKMPPRGELSGQESMESDINWNEIQHYQEQVVVNGFDGNSWDGSGEIHSYVVNSDKKDITTVNVEALKQEELGESSLVSVVEKHELPPARPLRVDVNRKKVKKLIIKPKKSKEDNTQTNFDNVFTSKLKVGDNEEIVDDSGLDNKNDIKVERKPPVCKCCDKLFKTKKELSLHIREFHKLQRIKMTKCQACGEVFDLEHKFIEHLKIHPLECPICGKLFYRRQSLKLHTARHLGIKPFKCNLCEKAFLVKQKLEEHKNCHTGNSPIKCSMCSESFKRHSNLVQHRNRHHFMIKQKVKDYICFCGEVFHSKKKLAWHKEIHDSKPKACTQCSEKFIHMASLTRHMRRAHNAEYLPDDRPATSNTVCPICKGVYLKTSLEAHLKTHSSQKPFHCSICNKEFTTKWNLKLHKWTHTSRTQKPFKCDLCKGAFIRENDYISHMNSHKSLRPYTCNYCGAQFIRKNNCQRHVKEHENNKTFNCNVCGKTFHRSYYLKDHMRVHSGVRPYSCHICGKTSTTKSNHNKHVQIHHAREPVSTEN